MSMTPEKLHKAARLIDGVAKEIEAKGMPDHAQQLAGRADQVKSWARNMAQYQANGVELTPEWTQYIESATAEFLAMAGFPQQEQDRQRRKTAPEQRRPARRSERVR